MRITRREAIAAVGLTAAKAQEPTGIGVIGLGSRSRPHMAALRDLAGGRVVALSDLDSRKMANANEGLPGRAAAYTDWRELIRDRNVKVVVIVTPNYLHHEMAIEALRAGKDVLVEKPMAIEYAHAREMAEEAKRRGRILAVGMQRRYFPLDRKVKEIVGGGAIGEVKFISYNEFRGDWNPAAWQYTDPATGRKTNWRYLKETAGSSELEFSVHSYAMVHSLVTSPVARVSATGGTVHYRDRETRDVSAVLVDFDNGARLQHSFCLFAAGAEGSFTIVGERGVIQNQGGRLMLREGAGKPAEVALARSGESPETRMYTEFLRSVRERTPAELGPETAMEPTRIAWAADIAIREGRIVKASELR